MSWSLHIRNGSWSDIDASSFASGEVLESLTIERVLDMTLCDACSRSRETRTWTGSNVVRWRWIGTWLKVAVVRHLFSLAILRLLPTDRRRLLSGLVSPAASNSPLRSLRRVDQPRPHIDPSSPKHSEVPQHIRQTLQRYVVLETRMARNLRAAA